MILLETLVKSVSIHLEKYSPKTYLPFCFVSYLKYAALKLFSLLKNSVGQLLVDWFSLEILFQFKIFYSGEEAF